MTAPSTRGERWLAAVADEYDLALDANALVVEISRLIDRADRLQAEIDALPSLIVTTGHGPKTHPAVVEHRTTTDAIRRSLSTLGLDE